MQFNLIDKWSKEPNYNHLADYLAKFYLEEQTGPDALEEFWVDEEF